MAVEGSQVAGTSMASVVAIVAGRAVSIRLKLESENRWGSIKDRTALSLVDSVDDLLEHPDAVLVESTSGNLGVALAGLAAEMGRRFIAVVDPMLPRLLAERLVAAGADIEVVTRPDRQGGYLAARLAKVEDLARRLPRAVWTDQYRNPANPRAHYLSTAPELLRQAGDVDAVLVAVSTGGTLAGVSRYLRRHAPMVRVVAVDVPGSRVFGEPSGSRILTGIGAGQPSAFLRPADWDDVVIVDDATAIACCHQVRAATGLSLGGSSGAVVAACLRYLAEHPEVAAPVCICPDGGATYADTLYNAAWLAQRSIDAGDHRPMTSMRLAGQPAPDGGGICR